MERLGVFDSGIGGFNLVMELRKKSDVDIVFMADHKNLPYGNKKESELKEILIANMQWFKDKGINHVFLACNTASTFINDLRETFPDMIIDSIIEITAAYYHDKSDLMIFGTQRTVDAKGYNQYLDKEPSYHALSELASLTEANDLKATQRYLKRELKGLHHGSYLLGCTHYSIVETSFKKYLTGDILDSVIPVLDYYDDLVGQRSLEIYSSSNLKHLEDTLKDIFHVKAEVKPTSDDLKFIVVSDNHGKIDIIQDIVAKHKDAQLMFHCGDTEIDPLYLKDFYVVKGNNDYYYDYPKTLTINKCGYRFYITHSDEFFFQDRSEELYHLALRNHYDFVFYGHTHRFTYEERNRVHLLNPGSLSYNRDGTVTCYAIVRIHNQKVTVERVDI